MYKNLVHLIQEWDNGGRDCFEQLLKRKVGNNLLHMIDDSIWYKPPWNGDFNIEVEYFDSTNDYLIWEKTGSGYPKSERIYEKDLKHLKREKNLNQLLGINEKQDVIDAMNDFIKEFE